MKACLSLCILKGAEECIHIYVHWPTHIFRRDLREWPRNIYIEARNIYCRQYCEHVSRPALTIVARHGSPCPTRPVSDTRVRAIFSRKWHVSTDTPFPCRTDTRVRHGKISVSAKRGAVSCNYAFDCI